MMMTMMMMIVDHFRTVTTPSAHILWAVLTAVCWLSYRCSRFCHL